MKQNYERLSSEQKQKIPVDEAEIVFTYPYLIGIVMDEQTSKVQWTDPSCLLTVIARLFR